MFEIANIAAALNQLYHSEFGGKSYGRYYLTLEQMKKLSGRENMNKSTESKIAAQAEKEHGLLVTRVGRGQTRGFAVIQATKVIGWRPPSRAAIAKAIRENCQ